MCGDPQARTRLMEAEEEGSGGKQQQSDLPCLLFALPLSVLQHLRPGDHLRRALNRVSEHQTPPHTSSRHCIPLIIDESCTDGPAPACCLVQALPWVGTGASEHVLEVSYPVQELLRSQAFWDQARARGLLPTPPDQAGHHQQQQSKGEQEEEHGTLTERGGGSCF